jgi:hypothetical protein
MARYGMPRPLGTAWHCTRASAVPVESRHGLPGEPKDTQARYLKAAVHVPDASPTG